jgi:hypothetical protein
LTPPPNDSLVANEQKTPEASQEETVMKSLMPAVVRQYGDRGDYAPVLVVSWTVVRARIVVDDSGRIDGQRARERGQ